MARENNLDLATVQGTGAGGRITKEDVEGVITREIPALCRACSFGASRYSGSHPSARAQPVVNKEPH